MKVWKYPLQLINHQELFLPTCAEILTVQVQQDMVCLWALVDDRQKGRESRHITIFGTGIRMPDNPRRYIATFQMDRGNLIFHVFEEEVCP